LGFDPIPLDLPYPLALGYVTFGDGDGHQGSDTGFTKTDEALRNWASDAHKKTCGVGMMIIMPDLWRHRQLNAFTCSSRCLGPERATHVQ
jgi:hypothetical protein